MKNLRKISADKRLKTLISSGKVLLMLSVFAFSANIAAAQNKSVEKLNAWTFDKVSSREKDDEILPVSYKMRVSKNKDYDRIVFEFEEKEVPEYTIYYTKSPITIEPSHIENLEKPVKDEVIKVTGKAFVIINFALGFDGKNTGAKFSGEQNLPVLQDVEAVDWFENFFSFAAGLKAKKAFRVQELSNPTRLVVDFKH